MSKLYHAYVYAPENVVKNGKLLYEGDTPKEVILWADNMLTTFQDFSLMNELNEMQGHAGANLWAKEDDQTRFDNKYEIPLYFINLVLKEHNIQIGVRGEY